MHPHSRYTKLLLGIYIKRTVIEQTVTVLYRHLSL